MKKKLISALIFTLVATIAFTQNNEPEKAHRYHTVQHDGIHCSHHKQNVKVPDIKYNADGIQTDIVTAFPTVKSLKTKGKWIEVYDGSKTLLGFVVFSKPASDGIEGFNGETPVMIAFDKKKVITGVYLLPNAETPKFAKKVADAGFYSSWNGMTAQKARKKQVDAVSGATFTSRAVAQSVQATLKEL